MTGPNNYGKEQACPDCGKVVRNLAVHQRMKHDEDYRASFPFFGKQQAEENSSKGGVEPMAECVDCKLKDRDLRDREKELETAKARAVATERQLQMVTADYDKLKANPPEPDLNAFIKHCEDGSCARHAEQWNGIKSKIVAGVLTPDVIRAEAAKLGLGALPKRIQIGMAGGGSATPQTAG